MHLYLSSFHVGERGEELASMCAGKRIGFIPNAADPLPPELRPKSIRRSVSDVLELGIELVDVDLRDHFGDPAGLRSELDALGGVWVRGGNTFVLRQAMRLSGFDEIIHELVPTDFVYAGYSAGVCVLAPKLHGVGQVDDATLCPYPGSTVIWEGLGILDYLILPHYKSDHPESADIDREVEYCTEHGVRFRTLRDGEVIIDEISVA